MARAAWANRRLRVAVLSSRRAAACWMPRRPPRSRRGANRMPERPLIHTIVLAAAIVVAGFAVGSGVQRFRLADRSVSVKGVAERPVRADIALWPMRIVASGMELGPTQDKLATDQRAVRRFFIAHGLDSSQVELLSLEVTDKRSNPYEGNPGSARFAVSATIVARTDHPERLRQASQDV